MGGLYPTTCSRGNGRERVLRLTVTEPIGLVFQCSDTGSHVFQLSQQLGPLDACDAHTHSCVDHATLPFGCNYELPEVQPGIYNLIVQAFRPGDEGVVTLRVSGRRESIGESCDNGQDDDLDGQTDCADSKCVTAAVCARFSCRRRRGGGAPAARRHAPLGGLADRVGDRRSSAPCRA